MNPHRFRPTCLWFFLSALAFLASGLRAAEALPNIVLLMGDDHGWDETGYNGHPFLKTPVLDEMARTGLRLDRFYAGASLCSPTRVSIITGRHPNRSGTFDPGYSTRPEEIGLATLMRKAGYACGHFGKWHVGPVKADSPTNPGAMGFEEWLSHDNFFEMNPWLSHNGAPPVQFKGESSEVVVAEAVKFLDRAKREGRPFFVVVWFGSPHEPYSGLPQDLALYDHLPATFANRKVKLTSNETGLQVERLQREVLRERFAEITAMDRAIGQMRTHLREIGARDNTLLWYCGDNGTPPEAVATVPFRGEKGKIYEGGLRVPGIIEWPARIRKPVTSTVNAVTTDIFPTLCDLAGQPLPQRPLDGVSLKPLLEGRMTERTPIGFWNGLPRPTGESAKPYIDPERQKGTTPLVKLMDGIPTRNFENYQHPKVAEADFSGPRAWLDGRYKLVVDGEPNAGHELFDLQADPAEKNNLLKSRPEITAKMEKQLRTWQESVLQSLTGADYH